MTERRRCPTSFQAISHQLQFVTAGLPHPRMKSIHVKRRRLMAPDIAVRKGGEPIVALTAYHAHTAAIADNHCDFLLVGDSLGMVMHGFETTVPVPLDLMIMHGQAVVRGSKKAL